MHLNKSTAISPIDGRYRSKTEGLAGYFSEFAYMKYRIFVEVEYFIALCEADIPELEGFDHQNFLMLRNICKEFSQQDAEKIKGIESTINHDVKAVEYFLKGIFEENGWQGYKEFIHFGLTSQDINNTAIPAILKTFTREVYIPQLQNLISEIQQLSKKWNDVPMLARTHGQPASPTRMGKELMVFVERLENQKHQLVHLPFTAKFGGATGNFNAHKVAYPDIDWPHLANDFVHDKLGLIRQQYTTQIEHYDTMAALFHNMCRINTILLDFCRDIWAYISIDYFKQKVNKQEVGSSAMPHKVNPIDFENAEGNIGIANALFSHLAEKLPVSRLQRDLTDSTVTRNIGVAAAHTMIAFKSIENGLGKLLLNQPKMEADLDQNWMVLAEPIQTVLRKTGYEAPYEKLKELTRKNESIGKAEIHGFIDSLEMDEGIKQQLKALTPFNYTGF